MDVSYSHFTKTLYWAGCYYSHLLKIVAIAFKQKVFDLQINIEETKIKKRT